MHPFAAAATVVWCVLPEAATFPPAVNSHTQVEFTSIDLTAFSDVLLGYTTYFMPTAVVSGAQPYRKSFFGGICVPFLVMRVPQNSNLHFVV